MKHNSHNIEIYIPKTFNIGHLKKFARVYETLIYLNDIKYNNHRSSWKIKYVEEEISFPLKTMWIDDFIDVQKMFIKLQKTKFKYGFSKSDMLRLNQIFKKLLEHNKISPRIFEKDQLLKHLDKVTNHFSNRDYDYR